MTIEYAEEWYRFLCTGCAWRTETRYETRYGVDSTGAFWSMYLCGGVPCEAPAFTQVVCPQCHRAAVRVQLIGRAPTGATGQTGPLPS